MSRAACIHMTHSHQKLLQTLLSRAIKATALLLVPGLLAVSAQATTPVLFYSDLDSGPKTGGENNNGTIVTVVGKNFGATRGTSTVTVGAGAVAAYIAWSDTRVSVAIGSNAATGNIVLTTADGASNGLPFTVRPGNIYCVSTTGSNGNPGTFPSSCWAEANYAIRRIAAGDIVYALNGVQRLTEYDYGAALLITNSSGTAGSPKALVGYPGATVTFGDASSSAYAKGLYFWASNGGTDYWTLANLTLRGYAFAADVAGNNLRLVNIDSSAPNAVGNMNTANFHVSAATYVKIFGLYAHDSCSGANDPGNGIDPKYCHEMYFSTDSNFAELGWSHINGGTGHACRGVQIHSSPTGPGTGNSQHDISIHDNYIHGVSCDGINFASVDPSVGPVSAYNNVIAHAGLGGMTGNYTCISVVGGYYTGPVPTGTVDIYNNTLYDCGSQGGVDAAAVFRGTAAPGMTARLTNNVVYQLAGEHYFGTAGDSNNALISGSKNLL